MRYLQHADTSARLTSVRAASRGLGMLHSRVRSGISLLEVMFSIGVVMIGLVGIAALLPVAGAQARKGAVADAAARLGANGIREFHVRSMGNLATWRWFNDAGVFASAFEPVGPLDPPEARSFCLDPRFVARSPNSNWFPLGAAVQMRRITLYDYPLALNSQNILLADQVFTSGDSLIFDLPPDRTRGPIQHFAQPLTRRSTQSNISWMATIVPKLDRMGTNVNEFSPSDEYTLSVVVFSRRIIDGALNNEPSVMAGQFSGGELQVNTDLQLRSGDWVMLSTYLQPMLKPMRVHKWYRVANAGEFDPVLNVLNVTLVGPDWDWPAPQVTVVRGAVAVFEKTIRLETSSLWTY